MSRKEFGFETRAIHAGQSPDPTTGAIMTPVYMTSTFVQDSPGKHKGYEYARTQNPTREAFEANIASLEGGKFGLATASGCAATLTIINMLKAGDHVISSDDGYGGTYRLFDKIIQNKGIEFSFIDLTDLSKVESTIKPNTKMIWFETPTNPMLKVIDIEGISKLAKPNGILTAVDNTVLTPYFQRPLELGADIVCHSTTKFINGHSDIVGGSIVVNEQELLDKLHFNLNSMGTQQATFDSFMVMRSTKTLAVRMQAHEKNAAHISKFLDEHPKVEKVIYPGLASHPQHELAKKQASGFGGIISFVIKGGLPGSRDFLEKVKIFGLAESMGGVESLIEHPAIMTHASVPPDQRKALGIEDGFIRISVGIETLDDLVADLEQALQ